MATLHDGDVRDVLPTLAAGTVRCCVTSPPYWGLRDYGVEGQLGLERTPEEYVERTVAVFREVRRVLTDDGTLWLNLGDSYVSAPQGPDLTSCGLNGSRRNMGESRRVASFRRDREETGHVRHRRTEGLPPKNLVGIPWRVAFALQADGWYIRSDIIWAKPNPMPESVTDRPTKAHEYVFLLSKAERYYYDADAIAEPATFPDGPNSPESIKSPYGQGFTRTARSGNVTRKVGEERGRPGSHLGGSVPWEGSTRNARSVWTIATQPYPEAHFATFPEELARRCIVAGSAPGDTVLDPFSGSGTVAAVAVGNGRHAIGVELNPDYQDMARRRIGPMFVHAKAGAA